MTQLDLIERLMSLEPPLHLFGGFAEDAVLYGKVSRPHQDIDVLVWLDELPLRIEQGRALGFGHFQVRFEAAPGLPLAVGASSEGLDLELCVGGREPDGGAFFYRPSPSGLQRCWLPADALSYPPAMLDGIGVRTVSPLTLYQVREALADVFGGMRPKDYAVQAALHDRFLSHLSEADLRPRVQPVP
jgi:hypothetical protein